MGREALRKRLKRIRERTWIEGHRVARIETECFHRVLDYLQDGCPWAVRLAKAGEAERALTVPALYVRHPIRSIARTVDRPRVPGKDHARAIGIACTQNHGRALGFELTPRGLRQVIDFDVTLVRLFERSF